jgi:hypothetical protein
MESEKKEKEGEVVTDFRFLFPLEVSPSESTGFGLIRGGKLLQISFVFIMARFFL